MMRTERERPPVRPGCVERRFEALIFDWDGTAVPDRDADASELRSMVEELCALGMSLAVVSGATLGNVDAQLGARPPGPGSLHLLLNRGSEAYHVNEAGPVLVERRTATAQERAALDAAAELTAGRLERRGLEVRIVSERRDRRKIDLIPEPSGADPPKARVAELVGAVEDRLRGRGLEGLGEAVRVAEESAQEAGLQSARVTSDAKYVEIGLTGKADSAQWIVAELWRRGNGPGLVLIAGDEMGPLGGVPGSDAHLLVPEAARATAVSVGAEPGDVPPGVAHLGGGPGAFRALLADQLERRRAGEIPRLDGDSRWTLAVEGVDPERERAHESLLALADGRIGTRGALVADHPSATPLVVSAGAYRGTGPETELQPGPRWNQLGVSLDSGRRAHRALDLRTGMLRQEIGTAEGEVEAILLSSLDRPGTAALRVTGPAAALSRGPVLAPPEPDSRVDSEADDRRQWMWVGGQRCGLGAAAAEARSGDSGAARLDRVAAYRAGAERATARERTLEALDAAREAGFERLQVEHRAAWARRWEDADVEIDGDSELQLAVRVALFHLIASVADGGEAAVGARGLSGPAYRGHVFWDSDVFVMPFLAATHPEAARAMLEYRLARLPAAIATARAAGRAGAKFPWESDATGADVTPTSAFDRAGRRVAIRTGELEEHIVADVAWAVACYLDWTADEAFLAGGGARLLVETARYWASRVDAGDDGRAHIRGVIGPDEYHVDVDDNAYTNVMARWNLRRAAGLDPQHAVRVGDRERARWLALADALVDGYDPKSRLYEQFADFNALEPLVIAELAPSRPIAADLLLGPGRVRSSQVIKQADALMLHHLVPDEVAPGSLAPNLAFYEPRTAHASSLSPGIHAALFAQAGDPEAGLDALRLTARIDLDDLSETTAGGLHLAAMGSVWQALVFGFAGVRPLDGGLRVDPRLPAAWDALSLRLRFRGARARLRIDRTGIEVSTDRQLRLVADTEEAPLEIEPGTTRLALPRAGEEEAER